MEGRESGPFCIFALSLILRNSIDANMHGWSADCALLVHPFEAYIRVIEDKRAPMTGS
ncbi:hypothetical protein J2T09_000403 [Neorhizobium huautlense]|uniref:Uncharacterized protein n=1 Tax=Neorhizobium huautlense TaxID=67774 RepID=A0ABT9PMG8_9HYPH|nr:hypothetical protein [Neorhizobium huautlense]